MLSLLGKIHMHLSENGKKSVFSLVVVAEMKPRQAQNTQCFTLNHTLPSALKRFPTFCVLCVRERPEGPGTGLETELQA